MLAMDAKATPRGPLLTAGSTKTGKGSGTSTEMAVHNRANIGLCVTNRHASPGFSSVTGCALRSIARFGAVFGTVRLVRFGRLYQFDQHPAGIFRVYEVDPRVCGTAPGCVPEHTHAAFAQSRRGQVDVGDGIGQLLNAGPAALQKGADRGIRAERGEQLQLALPGADGQHCLPYALLLVALLVHHVQVEHAGIELERGIEVGHRYPDVVDPAEQPGLIGDIHSSPHRVRVGIVTIAYG